MKKQIVINFFAGPGAGKSTTAAQIFATLKMRGLNTELVTEFAKDKVWEESYKVLEDQIYIFGKQLHRLHRLKSKVDVIVTDSPLLLSIIYDKSNNKVFRTLVKDEFDNFDNINFYIQRNEKYNPNGRMQKLEEAKELDDKTKTMLLEELVPYTICNKGEFDTIIDAILSKIESVV